MYEAKQNKEKVSRVIRSGVEQQKENTMIVNKRNGIIQTWKSESLINETNRLYERLRGMALFNAQQYGDIEDLDEYSEDGDLKPYLDDNDLNLFSFAKRYEQLKAKGLTESIHHILSRDKIEKFYRELEPHVQEFLGGLFMHKNQNDNSPLYSLLSLRSNLILGPNGANREDDPAHIKDKSNDIQSELDPVYVNVRELSYISAIYKEIDSLIDTFLSKKQISISIQDEVPNIIEQIVNLLLDAEMLHANYQGKDSFWDTTLSTDVENIWEKTVSSKWKRKYSPVPADVSSAVK